MIRLSSTTGHCPWRICISTSSRYLRTGARSITRRSIGGRPQDVVLNPDGRFSLYRIGNAVSARNTHAAIYDAL